MSSGISLVRHGKLAVLTLNHPASLNSLRLGTIKALLSELRALACDPSIRRSGHLS